jgi:glucose/arabinose dehydrogenase
MSTLTFLYIAAATLAADQPPVERVRLPQGFRIAVYAHPVPNARSLALGAGGTVFVGSRTQGVVHALKDEDGDGRAESIRTFASGLDTPNGVAFKDGALYVAELSRILRFDDAEGADTRPRRPVVVSDAFPKDKHHGWKFIAFGPDGQLYVPVGAPCNICERPDPRYASITRLPAGGGEPEIVARGVRNTVGFDWHPETKQLWFTDNGRDMLGDDKPPDELNRASRAGLHFGYPYCHSKIPDPDFAKGRSCADFERPVQELGPHVAAIGMRFYTGRMFPAEYRNQVFIAEHGSWNRSSKVGYRLSLVRLAGDRAVSYKTFAEGWLKGEEAWGRPVDVLVLPDGSLLVSDDAAGAVYRITYGDARASGSPDADREH